MKSWSKILGAWLVASLTAVVPLRAQDFEANVYGVAVSNSEIDSVREAKGLGVAADARWQRGRVRVELSGLTASLRGDFSVQPDYALHELSASASYLWGPRLWFQLGIGRRFISPDFAAQEVGLLRVGVVSETQLSSLAQIEARANYFPLARFSGGGVIGLALGLGLGARVGRTTGRFHGIVEYTYERVDRKVNDAETPIKFSAARAGLGARF
jgi:hypothetical protein